MSFSSPSRLARYSLSVVSVGIALFVSVVFRSIFEESPFLLFWGAIAISSWYGGIGPGLVATALSALAVNYFFVKPIMSLEIDTIMLIRLSIFVALSVLIGSLYERNRKNEVRLKTLQSQLEAILTGVTDGITAQKPDGELIFANDAAAQLTGYSTREALLTAPVSEVMKRFEIFDEAGNAFPSNKLPGRLALQGQRDQRTVVRFRVAETKEDRWSVVKASPIFDEDGNVQMAINLFQDITDLKQTQETLYEQREQLRITLDSIGDGVIATDDQGMVQLMNPVAETLTGWSEADAVGHSIHEVFPIVQEKTLQLVENPVDEVLETGKVVLLSNHTALVRKDGALIPIEDSGAPIRNASGEITGAVLVFHDVTERRQVENTLRENYETLQAIINASPLPIVVFDLEGIVKLWSPAAERVFGWMAAEAIGRFMPTVTAEHRPAFLESIEIAKRGQIVVGLEATRRRKDGSFIEIGFSCAPLRDEEGKITSVITIAENITARKQAEAALRAAYQQIEVILEGITDAFYSVDESGRVTYVNQRAEELWGKTRDQLIGQILWEVLPNALGENTREEHERALREKTKITLEALPPIAGHWIEASIYPHDNGLSVYVQNIHERKQHEINQQFLMEAGTIIASSIDYETTLRNIALAAVPKIADWCAIDIIDENETLKRVAVVHTDPEKVKWAYELWERYPLDMNLPYGLPNVIRNNVPEFYPYISDELLVSVAQDEYALNALRTIGYRSVLIVPLTALGRTFGGLTLVTTYESGRALNEADVKLAQELALRAGIAVENARLYQEAQLQRERFKVTLASIGDAVIATDNQGKITFMNAVAQELTGWTEADAYSLPLETVFRIVNEDTRRTVESPVTKVLREGGIVGLANHTLLIAKNGREVPIDDSGAPIMNEQGKMTGVVLVFRDITDRKFIEQQRAELLRQEQAARRAAEEANELKLKFLAMISHELRTPLTSIKGFTSTLLAEDVSWDTDTQQEFIMIMDNEADKLTDLVEQLLDVSRLTAGTLSIRPEKQPIETILEVAMAQLQTLTANHQLLLNIPTDLPSVMVDSQRIAQVLVNLVDNAAKYSPPHSRITVAVEHANNHVRIDVSDEGEGIPFEERLMIFEAFRQAERQNSRPRGAGLGLAICKGLVEAHGGQIWIDDQPPPGTTISFTLPVNEAGKSRRSASS